MPLLDPVQFWHWWALGGLLVIIEAFAPGFVFLWLGAAAGLVGLLVLLWPSLDLDVQILVFAVLSVSSVVGWRRVQKAHPAVTDQPHLNRRGEQHVGSRVALTEPIVNGHGRVRIGDATWTARGPDLPVGRLVEITEVDGVVLTVRPVEEPSMVPSARGIADRPGGEASGDSPDAGSVDRTGSASYPIP
jgi:membrane protein implicated in regulation of membrane protease activity